RGVQNREGRLYLPEVGGLGRKHEQSFEGAIVPSFASVYAGEPDGGAGNDGGIVWELRKRLIETGACLVEATFEQCDVADVPRGVGDFPLHAAFDRQGKRFL